MTTVAILLLFGIAFAVFALLGPAEHAHVCDHARPGDPECEHCALDDADLGSDAHPGPGRG